MLRSGLVLAGAGAVFLLAGCSAGRPERVQLRAIPQAPATARREPPAPLQVLPPAAPLAQTAPAPGTGVPPCVPGHPSAGTNWILLASWVQAIQCGGTARLLGTTNLAVEFTAPQGAFRLYANNPWAYCDTLAVWLGFAPIVVDEELVIHRLQADKCLFPLLSSIPLPSRLGRTIVIDPGHGGENQGTRSVLDDQFEKVYTLDWGWRLASLLRLRGWNVVLTHTNDVDLSLAERVAIADRCRADLFVSLHFNSAPPQREQQGIETFCLTPMGLPSTITRDYDDDLTREFPNNAFDAQNVGYAFRLHRALVLGTGAPDRGVRRARFMGVLRSQSRPAVLVEGGYLSNPEEARLIASPEYRQRLAEALAEALSSSSSVAEVGASRPSASP